MRKCRVPNRREDYSHPLIKQLFDILYASNYDCLGFAARAGIPYTTIYRWKGGHMPSLLNLIACYEALGYRLTVEKIDDKS